MDSHFTDPNLRQRNSVAVELRDGQGKTRTVQLDELSDEDRALAEKFGYKPVSRAKQRPRSGAD